MKENTKRLKGEELKVVYQNNVRMYVLQAPELYDKPSIYTNKIAIIKRLESL